MYCPYCGTEMSRFLDACPYCKADTSSFLEDSKKEKTNILYACFPNINNTNALEYHIGDGYIRFDAEQMKYIRTYKLFNHITNKNCDLFSSYINEIKDPGKIADEYFDAAASLIDNVFTIAEMYFESVGKDIDIAELRGSYFPTIDAIIISPVISERDKIISKAEEKRIRADMAHEYNYQLKKDPWVGGGFGMKGAIKGAVQAKMLNVGANAFNRAVMGMKKASSHAAISSHLSDEMEKWIISARRIATKEFRVVSEDILATIMNAFSSDIHDKFKAAKSKAEKMFERELNETAEADYEEYDSDTEETNIFEDKLKQACKIVNLYPMESDYYEILYRCAGKKHRKEVMELLFNLTDTTTACDCATYDDDMYIRANMPALDDDPEDIAEKLARIMSLADANPIYTRPEYSKFSVYSAFTDGIFKCWQQTNKVSRIQDILTIVKGKQHKTDKKWQLAEKYPEIAYIIYHDLIDSLGDLSKTSKTVLAEKCEKELKAGTNVNDANANVILLAVFAEYNIANKLDSAEYQKAVEKYAEQGQPLAMDILGKWYYDGSGIYEKDADKAAFYFTYAGINYSPQALAYIGSEYKIFANFYHELKSLSDDLLKYAMSMNVPLAFKEAGIKM